MTVVTKIKGCVWAFNNQPQVIDYEDFVYSAQEQDIPWFVLKRWLASDRPGFVDAAAFHPNSPQYQTVELLKQQSSSYAIQWFLKRDDLTTPTLDTLLRSDLYLDCDRVTKHKNMTSFMLDWWVAGDTVNMPRWERLLACAESQHLSESTAQFIYDVACNEHSRELATEVNLAFCRLAQNSVTPTHILTELALHKYSLIRWMTSQNPSVSTRTKLLASLVP